MPGGYVSPFANPCGLPASMQKCLTYDHKLPAGLNVAASVNHTTLFETGGTGPSIVSPRGAPGASSVGLDAFNDVPAPNDSGYPAGPWPAFFGNVGSTYRPYNRFIGAGTVDLSGPCRQVGRQQAQFRRSWHGIEGFSTGGWGGGVYMEDCASTTARRTTPSATPFGAAKKYCGIEITSTLTCALGLTAVGTGCDGSVTNYSDSWSGTSTRAVSYSQSPTSGLVTLGSYSSVDGIVHNTDAPAQGCSLCSFFPDFFADGCTCRINALNPTPTTLPEGTIPGFPADFQHITVNYQGSAAGASPSYWTALMGFASEAFQIGIWAYALPTTFPVSVSVDKMQVSDSEIWFKVTATYSPPPTHTYLCPDGVTEGSYACGGGGTIVFEHHVLLTAPNALSDLSADIASLMSAANLGDRLQHPFRTDNILSGAELWSRNEPTTGRTCWMGNPGSSAWYDADMYFIPAGGTAADKLLIYDGSVIPGTLAAGTGAGTPDGSGLQFQGVFDFRHINRSVSTTCVPYTYGEATALYDASSGRSFLPPWCSQWTDAADVPAYYPGAFALAQTDFVAVQTWSEIQIRVPSENKCRPFGADSQVIAWDTFNSCDGSGNFFTSADGSGTPINPSTPTTYYKWPNCPGLTFDDAPGVGGRVHVISVDGTGVATLGLAQPYFCNRSWHPTESVKVFDAGMNYLGTVLASRVDDTHFGGFGAYPTAAWITPVNRNDGTAWAYSDCDDYPKGTWVSGNYLFSTQDGTQVGTPTMGVNCAVPNECGPTVLTASAALPGNSMRIAVGIVRQWDVSKFEIQQKCCEGGSLSVRPYFDGADTSPCGGAANATYLPQFVEAGASGSGSLLVEENTPAAFSGTCDAAGVNGLTPWNIYLSLPDQFPL